MPTREKGLAVVTGASSGIGREIARELSRRGSEVLAVARRADRLEVIADEAREAGWARVHPFAQDITAPGAGERIAGRARELGGARWLVNDAGAFRHCAFQEDDPEATRCMLRVNVEGLVLLTHALLPQLLEGRGARILNVASLAGMQPTPWFAAYGASKAFVISFSEALSEELRGQVGVTAFCPGPVLTEIFEAGAPGVRRRRTWRDVGADEAALAALDAAERGLVVAVPGATNWLMAAVARLAPRALVRLVARSAAVRYLGYAPPDR